MASQALDSFRRKAERDLRVWSDDEWFVGAKKSCFVHHGGGKSGE